MKDTIEMLSLIFFRASLAAKMFHNAEMFSFIRHNPITWTEV